MPVQLTPAEAKYFSLLRQGLLLNMFPSLTGYIDVDWDKWIVIYNSLK